MLFRERPAAMQIKITAVTYKDRITLEQMNITLSQASTTILSVSRDGSHQLIVGQQDEKTIYIYNTTSTSYHLFKTLHLPTASTNALRDAIWTSNGHIVYCATVTTSSNLLSNDVVIMSQNGDVISQTNMTNAQQLSLSTSNVMYLADMKQGVYQSSNSGLTWSFTFNLTDSVTGDSLFTSGWFIRQALEVSKNQNFVLLWSCEIENNIAMPSRLRIYKIRSNNDVTEIAETVNITAPVAHVSNHANFMEFDGLETVLISCYDSSDVHLFNATSGAYLRAVNVVSESHVGIKNYPERLAIDRYPDEQVVLYVGHLTNGTVSIHTLTYEE